MFAICVNKVFTFTQKLLFKTLFIFLAVLISQKTKDPMW